jgi:FKBP-type peptidyl-prolyl cis-trans isomerase
MRLPLLLLAVLPLLSACAPKEKPVVQAPQDPAVARRDFLFGPRSAQPDIVWRPSGLGIRLVAAGDGPSPQAADKVRVHYVGSLKDGKVFDDSRARGTPGEFVVSRLIPGWAAAMTSLKVGGRAEVFVPPSLGYGNMSVGGIPAGSGLIFDVELLAINP